MTVSTQVGPIITGDAVRAAVLAHLQTWMPMYIQEIALQRGRTDVPSPIKSWATRIDFDQLPGDALPTVVVVVPGLSSRPYRKGDGTYQVEWAVGLGVIAMADTEEHTMALAELYTAALRACLVQHGDVSGFALGVSWEDERYDDRAGLNMRPDDARTLAAGQVMFTVTIDKVIKAAGPLTPPPPPELPGDWPLVDEVFIESRKVPV